MKWVWYNISSSRCNLTESPVFQFHASIFDIVPSGQVPYTMTLEAVIAIPSFSTGWTLGECSHVTVLEGSER